MRITGPWLNLKDHRWHQSWHRIGGSLGRSTFGEFYKGDYDDLKLPTSTVPYREVGAVAGSPQPGRRLLGLTRDA
jgi:hypothetical protein